MTCLIGRNGAGKSSLVNALAGLVKPSGGRIVLDGKDLSRAGAATRSRAGIALVPESRRVYGSLSALENIWLGARGNKREAEERLASIIELFPAIERFQDRGGNQLSGGEQQMVAIARALMCDPKVLVLDEPSLGLAPIVVKAVLGGIEQLALRGQAILLIEQNGRAALRISQHAYAMARGEIHSLDHQSPEFNERELQALYL
ncbi:ABC transporter ATP-binding protein [Nocardioides humi]|uniref:ABC transporter ATP-binding protein n=1 Tax=Nocardioides humi TaxID=449461 RepID=UPI00112DE476|nr:ATP-binding cassette domain-containing protein [Nocardioides humi]